MKQRNSSPSDLHVESITKTFSGRARPANNNVTVSFAAGTLTALIGHNGAGKTTLLNQIVGSLQPDSGEIRYGDLKLSDHPEYARRIVAMMPQLQAPLHGVTPRQAITAIARIRGLSRQQASQATQQILSSLDLDLFSDTQADKLSGGFRRLTSFAMAVAAPAPVLLIDEPTNDVDPLRRTLIWQHLRKLADSGHCVVVVSHNLLEVERYADRFVLMHKGEMRSDNTPQQLANQFNAAVLEIVQAPGCVLEPFEKAQSVDFYGGNIMRMQLEPRNIPAAIEWVLEMCSRHKVERYTLAPESLESFYERITHE
ncbi:MAG: ABC transporter ATP-binding protein [Corynebacterium sp.]|uniref:ABC transporter ATP-binding protein n=1 Tax=Corynebacterium sp. TaxID=1720 RepID=UPI0026DBC1DB|nr:ABC transporter ATP-binding protein [Corynebacterium sp.]MDO4761596.1 ABC transporter ATP-binding protein [Corynebacterium sp.]